MVEDQEACYWRWKLYLVLTFFYYLLLVIQNNIQQLNNGAKQENIADYFIAKLHEVKILLKTLSVLSLPLPW